MPDAASSLDAFPAASQEDWAALVRKTLKGGDPGRLVHRTADGLIVQPLHAPAEHSAPQPRRAPADPARPWDVRARVAHPDPAAASRQALEDLEGGAASLLLAVDPVGRQGVGIGSADALARALDGVLLGLAPVALDAGWAGPAAAEWLARAAVGLSLAPLAFHLDPLTAFADSGRSPGPLAAQIETAAATAARLGADLVEASLFLASGRAVHEAGGTEAQELGFALASALAYAKALDAAGLPPAAAFPRIVLGVSVDAEPMLSVAKLRAARVLWTRVAAACGSDAAAVIEARSSRRMLARLDPWTNLLRLTAAGFAGAVGGADAVVLGTFTDALGEPTAFARRQARNTQLVLMEEAHLGRVSDPASGSGLIEALTDDLARAAWCVFQAIEAQGGAAAALESGWLGGEVARARAARQADIARRKVGLIGVSEFPDLASAEVKTDLIDRAAFSAPPLPSPPGPDSTCPPLEPVRWAEPFERLRERAGASAPRAGLAVLGPAAEHAARAGFARALLAAGGIASADLAPGETAPLAILCGADERYAAEAESAARALKAAGAREVWLAGRPGEHEAAWRAAGVDRFVYAGGDAVEALETALDVLG
jgi:methylmalonyl-CoA mutase